MDLEKIKGSCRYFGSFSNWLIIISRKKQTNRKASFKKTYYTTFTFGATTPSFDLETDISSL